MVMFQFATFNHRVTIRWNGRFCWRSKVQVFVIVVQFLWELKQNQPVLTRSMAPALNSGEDEIEKKFQAMVKAGPCSSAGIVYIPTALKTPTFDLLGRAWCLWWLGVGNDSPKNPSGLVFEPFSVGYPWMHIRGKSSKVCGYPRECNTSEWLAACSFRFFSLILYVSIWVCQKKAG